MPQDRLPPPTHIQIAQYWCGQPEFRYLANKPQCFACGYHRKAWKTNWGRAKRLQKAHIIAFEQGGKDIPSNYVLLCNRCHLNAPVTADRNDMIEWCLRHESWAERRLQDIIKECEKFGIDFYLLHIEPSELLKELRTGHYRLTDGEFTAATIVAAIRNCLDDPVFSLSHSIVTALHELAEYEVDIISRRTKEGMRRARKQGKKIGNQPNYFDKERATRLKDEGWGQIKIAKALKVGVGTVNRWVNEEYIPPEERCTQNENTH